MTKKILILAPVRLLRLWHCFKKKKNWKKRRKQRKSTIKKLQKQRTKLQNLKLIPTVTKTLSISLCLMATYDLGFMIYGKCFELILVINPSSVF